MIAASRFSYLKSRHEKILVGDETRDTIERSRYRRVRIPQDRLREVRQLFRDHWRVKIYDLALHLPKHHVETVHSLGLGLGSCPEPQGVQHLQVVRSVQGEQLIHMITKLLVLPDEVEIFLLLVDVRPLRLGQVSRERLLQVQQLLPQPVDRWRVILDRGEGYDGQRRQRQCASC